MMIIMNGFLEKESFQSLLKRKTTKYCLVELTLLQHCRQVGSGGALRRIHGSDARTQRTASAGFWSRPVRERGLQEARYSVQVYTVHVFLRQSTGIQSYRYMIVLVHLRTLYLLGSRMILSVNL